MMATEDELEPWFVPHGVAMKLLGYRSSYYWGLVRKGKIRKVGTGKASRAVFASVKEIKAELLAEAAAKSGEAA
jgi:hypothetical protein